MVPSGLAVVQRGFIIAFAQGAAMMMRPFLLSIGLSLLLAACSDDPAVPVEEVAGNSVSNALAGAIDDTENAVDEVVNNAVPTPAALMGQALASGWGQNVDAFAGKDIDLEPLPDAAALRGQGGMGCTFLTDGARRPLLTAKAPLDARAYSLGVVANDGVRARLVSAAAGGFAGMASGMRFDGRGVSVEVKLGSRESLTPVGKSSSYPANLVVKAGEGRQRVYSGQWICGL